VVPLWCGLLKYFVHSKCQKFNFACLPIGQIVSRAGHITGSEARAIRVNLRVQSKVFSRVSACLPVGFITVSEYQVNY
jgi:hypothetical protein